MTEKKNLYGYSVIKGPDSAELDISFLSLYSENSKDFNATAILGKYGSTLFSEGKISSSTLLEVTFGADHGEGTSSISSTFVRPLIKFFESTVKFKPIDFNFYSTTYIAQDSDFYSKFSIRDFACIDLLYEAIQAPDNYLIEECVKDTYVSSYRPTLNYGKSASLLTGPTLLGDTKTYMCFSLSNIFSLIEKGMNIINLYLELSFPESYKKNLRLRIISNDWDEYSVTWRTSVKTTSLVFPFECSGNSVKLDVYDIIYKLYEIGISKFNFVIESDEECLIYSKESKYAPKITMLWRDSSWNGFVDKVNLLSTAFIRGNSNRDFFSLAELFRTCLLEGQSCLQLLRNNINSFAKLAGYEQDTINSKAILKLLEKDLQSIAVIRKSSYSDLQSNFHNPNQKLFSSASLKVVQELFSTFQVKNDSMADVLAKTILISYGIESVCKILERSLIDCNAIIRGNGDADINSTVKIEPLISSLVSIAKLSVGVNYLDLMSCVSLIGNNFTGTTSLKVHTNVSATANIRTPYANDFSGEVHVMNSNELEKRLSSSVVIVPSKKDLYSYSYLNGFYLNDFSSTVNLDRIGKILESSADIFGYQESKLSGYSVIEKMKKDLYSEYTLRKNATKDISSVSVIRRSSLSNLTSEMNLFHTSKFNSFAEFVQLKDFLGESVLRQTDIAEVDSFAVLSSGSNMNEFNGISYIVSKDVCELIGIGKIDSDARHWVPYIHAHDIFTFNRKLPRQI